MQAYKIPQVTGRTSIQDKSMYSGVGATAGAVVYGCQQVTITMLAGEALQVGDAVMLDMLSTPNDPQTGTALTAAQVAVQARWCARALGTTFLAQKFLGVYQGVGGSGATRTLTSETDTTQKLVGFDAVAGDPVEIVVSGPVFVVGNGATAGNAEGGAIVKGDPVTIAAAGTFGKDATVAVATGAMSLFPAVFALEAITAADAKVFRAIIFGRTI